MIYNLITFLIILVAVFGYDRNELRLQDPEVVGEVVKSPLPHTYIKSSDLPDAYDIRNIDGMNFATTDLNQHIPQYCGSCWAHASFSSIADRLRIASKGSERDVIPSVQALINCGSAGSCNGGDSNAANAWVYKNGGIPDVTCQQYEASNNICIPENYCRNCDYGSSSCYAMDEYPLVTVSEYGSVTGEENIMAEMMARGPVACYIDANCIEEYDGGVADYSACGVMTNHAIQLSGWGEDEGTPYWIGRNSWGTYWGEHGWFRIKRGVQTEGSYLPKTCYWAVPDTQE